MLKSLILQQHSTLLHFTDDEDKQTAVVLHKNYALEQLPDIKQEGDVGAILSDRN
jgi:hypothetical protein